jgi:hypothetical protein
MIYYRPNTVPRRLEGINFGIIALWTVSIIPTYVQKLMLLYTHINNFQLKIPIKKVI